jgi:hypothetical protein
VSSYKPAYYIALRRRGKRFEVTYSIGGESSTTTVYRIGGRGSQELFENITENLARLGGLIPVKATDREVVYGVREDLGPIIGGLILASLSVRNVTRWNKVIEEILVGNGRHLQNVIPLFLEVSLELNRAYTNTNEKAKAQRALSTTLRQFLEKLSKAKA